MVSRRMVCEILPDVVLMDIDMPELDGIDTVAIAKTVYPSIRFLMLTVYDDEDLLFSAIKACIRVLTER